MGKRLLAALGLAAVVACAPDRTAERYGDRIRAAEWSGLDALSAIAPPADLRRFGEEARRFALPPGFDRRVVDAAGGIWSAPHGAVQERVATLTLEEAIALDRDIVASWLSYRLVDEDPAFIDEHGRGLTLGKHLAIGEGDCSQYSQAFVAVFAVLQDHNPRLRNVVVGKSGLGGNLAGHEWNTVAVPTATELVISHVDVSDYDDGGTFPGEADAHYPSDPREFVANVYLALGEPGLALRYRWERFADLRRRYNAALPAARAGDAAAHEAALDSAARILLLLKDVARDAYLAGMTDDLRLARLRASELSPRAPYLDQIIYYSALAEEEQGFPKTAAVLRSMLRKRFPDSYWTGSLQE